MSLSLALTGMAVPVRALDDEPTNLLVRRESSGGVELTWTAPVQPADSYDVRRCYLPALRTGTYGNCIVTGLATESYIEAPPRGSIFYLVSARYGPTEGPLGEMFDGSSRVPRVSPACGVPTGPGSLTAVIVLDSNVSFCGTQVTLAYPPYALTYDRSEATGLQTGWFWLTNATLPGRVIGIGATSDPTSPVMGPGELARIHFRNVDCPLADTEIVLTSIAVSDCSGNELPSSVAHVEIVP